MIPRDAKWPLWKDLSATLVICALAGVTWLWMDYSRDNDRRTQTAALAQTIALQVQADLGAQINAIERMANRWSALGGLSAEFFTTDAIAHLADMPGIRALSWADRGHVARYVVPSTNARSLGRNIAQIDPARARTLAYVKRTGVPRMTPPIQLIDGTGTGILIFVPVSVDGQFDGTLNLVVNVETWMSALFRRPEIQGTGTKYALRLLLDDEQVFQTDDWAGGERVVTSAGYPVLNRTLKVALTRLPEVTGGLDAPSSVAIVIAALLGTGYLMLRFSLRLSASQIRVRGAYASLEQMNDRLTEEVAERSAAEQRAISAVAFRSRFLANMSHEIRTPMNAIMGMFELLASADIPERQRQRAGVGLAAAHKLFDQLTNIISLSQQEARSLTLKTKTIDTEALAQHWALALEALARTAGTAPETEVVRTPDCPASFCADPKRLDQILEHLLDNAVRYCGAGKVSLGFRGSDVARGEPADRLVISIADTGPGLPTGEREKIFRHYGGDVAFGGAQPGSGYGLSVVKELVDLMTLDIAFAETPGGGTTIHILCPLAARPTGQTDAESPIHTTLRGAA